jgi:putative hemolysin
MSKKRFVAALAALLALALLAAACGDDDKDDESQLPNPASVYCEEQGGTLEIRDEEGGQVGYCLFDDGSECEEWAFMRGECSPGQSLGGDTGIANPASVFCAEQGGTVDLATGICSLPDGTQCDEWALYRGECGPGQATGGAVLGGDTQRPNPAAVYCEEQGGTSEIVTAADGSQSGVCHFADGSACDEWAFFRGDCAPGN